MLTQYRLVRNSFKGVRDQKSCEAVELSLRPSELPLPPPYNIPWALDPDPLSANTPNASKTDRII